MPRPEAGARKDLCPICVPTMARHLPLKRPGRGPHRFSWSACSSPLSGCLSRIPKESERFEIAGNGCPGSTAWGVRTGKILEWKNAEATSLSFALSSFQETIRMPFCSRLGLSFVSKISSWCFTSSLTARRILLRNFSGSAASPGTPLLASSLCLRLPTRFMKNSSRLEVHIERNRTRSRSGIAGLEA